MLGVRALPLFQLGESTLDALGKQGCVALPLNSFGKEMDFTPLLCKELS
jgi:hypothetical protein